MTGHLMAVVSAVSLRIYPVAASLDLAGDMASRRYKQMLSYLTATREPGMWSPT